MKQRHVNQTLYCALIASSMYGTSMIQLWQYNHDAVFYIHDCDDDTHRQSAAMVGRGGEDLTGDLGGEDLTKDRGGEDLTGDRGGEDLVGGVRIISREVGDSVVTGGITVGVAPTRPATGVNGRGDCFVGEIPARAGNPFFSTFGVERA
jgi:hypothetical protein